MIHGIDPERVTAAVFDLGGVILAGGPEVVESFGLGCGLDAATWKALRLELFADDGPWAAVERGEQALEEFATLLRDRIRAAGGKVDLAAARNFMSADGRDDRQRLRPDIVAAVRRIHCRMPTALLTNNVAEWRPLWRSALAVADLFDVIIDSSEQGTRKPDPRIYELTRSRLGVPHESIFFVDDMGQNLKAARALGWQTLRYEDTQQVLDVLGALAAGPVLR